jgi:succinyl-CoA synthetase alpha subunit
MSILVNSNTKVVVQGITGREGEFHTRQMLEYGTKVVAGVTPGKGGLEVAGVPVHDTVREAVRERGANVSVVFVPAGFAADAMFEAMDAGVEGIVCITEGIPVHDMIKVVRFAREAGVWIIGPNGPGITSPPDCKVGIMPGSIFAAGQVGLVSRSGTLTYEIVAELTAAGVGQSTCVGIGGDPIPGTQFLEILRLFEADPKTRAVVLIGEIGGADEETAAEYVRGMKTPVVAFVAGKTAPPGKRMGHAGAIISGSSGTAAAKIAALEAVGVPVAEIPSEVPGLVEQVLRV